jgi:hypothetical protein
MMAKQKQKSLDQLENAYRLQHLDAMGMLQNKLVEDIAQAQMVPQDVLMVLTVVIRQVEDRFIGNLYSKE